MIINNMTVTCTDIFDVVKILNFGWCTLSKEKQKNFYISVQ